MSRVPLPPADSMKLSLLAEIARGGMGSVELSRVESGRLAGQIVAIKRLHANIANDPEFVSMFLDEACITAALHHPNVVGVAAWGNDERGMFLAIEFVQGVSLQRLLKESKQNQEMFAERTVANLCSQICCGLQAAHNLRGPDGDLVGLVHRDLTPGNVLVRFDGVVKIVDFGIAKAEERISHTRTGQLKGKPAYMSPEQARGSKLDHRADIFSFGVMMYELLAGRRPWVAKAAFDVMMEIANEPAPNLAEFRPNLNPEFVALVHKCLEKKPEDRFFSAAEIQTRLDHWRAQKGFLADDQQSLAGFVGRNSTAQIAWYESALRGDLSRAAAATFQELEEKLDAEREQKDKPKRKAPPPLIRPAAGRPVDAPPPSVGPASVAPPSVDLATRVDRVGLQELRALTPLADRPAPPPADLRAAAPISTPLPSSHPTAPISDPLPPSRPVTPAVAQTPPPRRAESSMPELPEPQAVRAQSTEEQALGLPPPRRAPSPASLAPLGVPALSTPAPPSSHPAPSSGPAKPAPEIFTGAGTAYMAISPFATGAPLPAVRPPPSSGAHPSSQHAPPSSGGHAPSTPAPRSPQQPPPSWQPPPSSSPYAPPSSSGSHRPTNGFAPPSHAQAPPSNAFAPPSSGPYAPAPHAQPRRPASPTSTTQRSRVAPQPGKSGPSVAIIVLIALPLLGLAAFGAWQIGAHFRPPAAPPAESPSAPAPIASTTTSPGK